VVDPWTILVLLPRKERGSKQPTFQDPWLTPDGIAQANKLGDMLGWLKLRQEKEEDRMEFTISVSKISSNSPVSHSGDNS
jgi:hypothetical protein